MIHSCVVDYIEARTALGLQMVQSNQFFHLYLIVQLLLVLPVDVVFVFLVYDIDRNAVLEVIVAY